MRESAAEVIADGRIIKAVLHGEYERFPDVLKQLIEFAPLGFDHPVNGQIMAAYKSARLNGGNIASYLEGEHVFWLQFYQTSKEVETPDAVAGDAKKLLNVASKRKIQDAMASIEAVPSQAFKIFQELSHVKTNGSLSSRTQERWSVRELMNYDHAKDPNAVIGIHDGITTRYLCKGGGAWLIGQSGIGKSSLGIQQGFTWALGRPFFGITPVRPLRVLIVQSENDQGDCSEATQGVCESVVKNPQEFDEIENRVRIIRCRGKTGKDFCAWLEHEVFEWKADLVYVDPLLRYAGIDVSRQDQCTKFLNEQMDPMLASTGVVLIGAHHTGKPKSKKETAGWTIYDYAYSGIGSSELVNWARAISILMVLSENEGTFELMLSKRGPRAWATHPNGDFTTSIYLKHSQKGICWEQINPDQLVKPPENEKGGDSKMGRPSKVVEFASMNLFEFCNKCLAEGEGILAIAKRFENYMATQRKDVSITTARRVIAELVANGKISKTTEGKYVKGPNA